MNKNINIIKDTNGKNIVIINDLHFRGRRSVNWNIVENHLKKYIGDYAMISETSDVIYIGSDFPDEFTHSKDTRALRGANMHAKANSSSIITELIEIATNKTFSKNYAQKHKTDAKFGWYRYDIRFAIPVYDNATKLNKYNIFRAKMLIRHSHDGKMYLYDILRTKKETSKPFKQ